MLTTGNSTAENALRQEESKPNYSLTLLNIVASTPLPLKTRLAAALAFKNFIRLNYVVCAVERVTLVFPVHM
jgi:exportin-2 (importin alpha re-exporter)